MPTNTIFQIGKTRAQKDINKQQLAQYIPIEYALATYSGLAFIQVQKNKGIKINPNAIPSTEKTATGTKKAPPPYDIVKLGEVYFKDKNVSRFKEYAEDLYAVCLFKDDNLYLLDRKKGLVTQKIRNPSGKSCSYEICAIPGFHAKKLPFLFMRDDKTLKLIFVGSGASKLPNQILNLAQAKYESPQSYQTMELIVPTASD